MLNQGLRNRLLALTLFAVLLGAIPLSGASAVIGSVAGGANATLSGQNLKPNTTLFSGDTLRVNDGVAVVAIGMGSRMVFGHDTVASFASQPEEVTVSLGQGNVSLYHPKDGMALRVKIGAVSVLAGKGFKTVGDVAMVNGAIVVTAREGTLQVQGPERSLKVTKGKTVAIMQEKKPAGTPKPNPPQAGGLSAVQLATGASLGAAGLGTTLAVVNVQKTNQAQTQAGLAGTDSLQAGTDSNAATTAANAAGSDANQASNAASGAATVASASCTAVSPSDTSCATH